MPIDAERMTKETAPDGAPHLVRLVECLGGEVEVTCDISPRPDYARVDAGAFVVSDGRCHGDVSGLHMCIQGTQPLEGMVSTITVRSGDTLAFGLTMERASRCPKHEWDMAKAVRLLRSTQDYWRAWIERCSYHGQYQEHVWRSALALKLMTYAPTGAIIAAPTTSLPEAIGGARNWDYRFTWLRDAAFTLFAFFQLNLTDEAHGFFRWLTEVGIGSDDHVDNLYAVTGRGHQAERELEHLEGYRGSRPVRVGNAAAHQLQLDVYGEVLDSAYLYARFGGQIDAHLWKDLSGIVELAIAHWDEPDASIWEVRGPLQHFTYSKVMCWVAVDRGLRIAERFSLPHDAERWRSARRAIHRRVTSAGWSEKRQAFTQTLGSDVLDASLLRLPQVRFLSDSDPRVRSTVQVISRELRDGQLMRRYRVGETDDGVPGDEGGFLMCGFWLADALAHFGQLEQAQREFEKLLCFASPLGLYAEEAEHTTGELLGNFPQALTHLSLVGAAVNMERARRREIGLVGLRRPAH
jgi:GH15 family glucan-1,4-alpha-glucosidase